MNEDIKRIADVANRTRQLRDALKASRDAQFLVEVRRAPDGSLENLAGKKALAEEIEYDLNRNIGEYQVETCDRLTRELEELEKKISVMILAATST